MNVFEMDHEYVANTYARFPVNIVEGKGSILKDETGKEYIDLGSGIAVNSFGMADEKWIGAVTAQLHAFQHTSNLFYTQPCAQLAQKLCQRTGMKKVFFSNSGAESNETAIKAAREYASLTKGPDCYTIVSLKNSFHGRTLATLAATGQDTFHQHFGPMPQGFVSIDPTTEALEEVVKTTKVAGIMFEAIQGEGGIQPLNPEFVWNMARIAKEHDIVLIADEVQCGNGRSGKLYAYMNYAVQPDVVTTAKGIGGGLPIGVTMLGEKVQDVFKPGLNGSTFGGNPVCCAGAISILDRIDDALMSQVAEKSKYIFQELSGAKGVESVSGMGLMIGVKPVKPTPEVVAKCREKGVLVLTAKDKLRLLPPLNIPFEQLKQAVAVLKSVCGED